VDVCKVLRGYPVTVAQNTAVSDTYRGIGDSIGRYSGILIPGIGGIDRKTDGCFMNWPKLRMSHVISRSTVFRIVPCVASASKTPRICMLMDQRARGGSWNLPSCELKRMQIPTTVLGHAFLFSVCSARSSPYAIPSEAFASHFAAIGC
jgi:hypothetical protein